MRRIQRGNDFTICGRKEPQRYMGNRRSGDGIFGKILFMCVILHINMHVMIYHHGQLLQRFFNPRV